MYEAFERYVAGYDLGNIKIKHKYEHIMLVLESAKILTNLLNLSDEDKYLAEAIALLHDIGRFEQLKRYNTFFDKDSIDHGDFAVKLLFEESLIEMFQIDKRYYHIIEKAILYHNKLIIGSELTEEEFFHAELIRDIDKIAIIECLDLEARIGHTEADEVVSPSIVECIKEEKTVSYNLIENDNDKLAVSFGYVFDIKYDETIKIIYDKGCYEKYYQGLKYKKYFKEIFNIVTNYMEKRLNLKG